MMAGRRSGAASANPRPKVDGFAHLASCVYEFAPLFAGHKLRTTRICAMVHRTLHAQRQSKACGLLTRFPFLDDFLQKGSHIIILHVAHAVKPLVVDLDHNRAIGG